MSQITQFTRVLYVREADEFRIATNQEVLHSARRAVLEKFRRGRSLKSPNVVREYLRLTIGVQDHETFTVIFLDSHHRLIESIELFRGTIDGAAIYVREVLKEALRYNAAGCLVAHNHPSGVAEPSAADELVTRKLKDALALLDIRLFDHLVVAGDQVVSFAERGLL